MTGESYKRTTICPGNCPKDRVKMHMMDTDHKCGALKRCGVFLCHMERREVVYMY